MLFHLILGVILALMLNMKFKGKKFLRTIVLIPWAMPMVVAGLAARWAFNDQYGLINDLIRKFIPNFHFDWLVHAGSAQGAVIAVDLWKDLPFFSILVLAALQFLSADIYEAAKIDGASPFAIFRKITIPLLRPTILLTTIMSINGTLQLFDESVNLTGGGPANSTLTMSHYIYKASFEYNPQFGYAAAMWYVIFIMVAILSFVQMKVGDKR